MPVRLMCSQLSGEMCFNNVSRSEEHTSELQSLSEISYAVFCALLMGFHNAASGRCFPSYDRLQEAAGCCRQTVAASLAALEAAGLLGVCNRLVRVRGVGTRVVRNRTLTSNGSGTHAARRSPAGRRSDLKPSDRCCSLSQV